MIPQNGNKTFHDMSFTTSMTEHGLAFPWGSIYGMLFSTLTLSNGELLQPLLLTFGPFRHSTDAFAIQGAWCIHEDVPMPSAAESHVATLRLQTKSWSTNQRPSFLAVSIVAPGEFYPLSLDCTYQPTAPLVLRTTTVLGRSIHSSVLVEASFLLQRHNLGSSL